MPQARLRLTALYYLGVVVVYTTFLYLECMVMTDAKGRVGAAPPDMQYKSD